MKLRMKKAAAPQPQKPATVKPNALTVPPEVESAAQVPLHEMTRHERRLQKAVKEVKRGGKGSKKTRKVVLAAARASGRTVDTPLIQTDSGHRAAEAKTQGGKKPAAVAKRIEERKKRDDEERAARLGGQMRLQTSTEMSMKQRMATMQSEMVHMKNVVQHPVYAADPMAAIQQHLSQTVTKLQPQTPDLGRAPKPPSQHAVSGHRRKR